MVILPAVDIKDGQCVRLYKGSFDTVERVADDPIATAVSFKEAGAEWIHMVDLDGALEGKTVNRDIFIKIAKESRLKTELGGGIRDLKTVEYYLKNGIDKVILGTAALKDRSFVCEAVKLYNSRIAVGIDAKDGMVSGSGWLDVSEIDYVEFAKQMEQAGVENVIYTNIDHDGTLKGPDCDGLKALQKAVKIKITASGGIKDMEHIKKLNEMGLFGVICGKSIYSGNLDLKTAVDYCENIQL